MLLSCFPVFGDHFQASSKVCWGQRSPLVHSAGLGPSLKQLPVWIRCIDNGFAQVLQPVSPQRRWGISAWVWEVRITVPAVLTGGAVLCPMWWCATFAFASLLRSVSLLCPFSRVCQVPGYLCFLLLLQYPVMGHNWKNYLLLMVTVCTITGAHAAAWVTVDILSISTHVCLNTSFSLPDHCIPRLLSIDFQLEPH